MIKLTIIYTCFRYICIEPIKHEESIIQERGWGCLPIFLSLVSSGSRFFFTCVQKYRSTSTETIQLSLINQNAILKTTKNSVPSPFYC